MWPFSYHQPKMRIWPGLRSIRRNNICLLFPWLPWNSQKEAEVLGSHWWVGRGRADGQARVDRRLCAVTAGPQSHLWWKSCDSGSKASSHQQKPVENLFSSVLSISVSRSELLPVFFRALGNRITFSCVFGVFCFLSWKWDLFYSGLELWTTFLQFLQACLYIR